MKFKTSFIILSLGIALLLSTVVSCAIGQLEISILEICETVFSTLVHPDLIHEDLYADIIFNLRLPRILLAALVGCGLAMCGSVMQVSVQNPLADPYILGISSGASLGATFSILIGWGTGTIIGELGVAVWAFSGAVLAIAFVFFIAGFKNKISSVRLILAGVIINTLCISISNFLVYFAQDAEGIRSVAFWTMGSLANADWGQVKVLFILLALCSIYLLSQRKIMNIMLNGDEIAITLGVDGNLYRKIYMAVVAILTGFMVANCGVIGFVGLTIPHIIRGIMKTSDNKNLPIVMLAGAIFLVWADFLSRTLIYNGEIPIGIITSMIGTPLFLFVFIQKGYGFNKN